MDKHPITHIIDTHMKSRNIKNVLKRINPLVKNKVSLYILSENSHPYIVLAYGKPIFKYNRRKIIDHLSGLTYSIREASILHGNNVFMQVYWDGSYFRIKTMNSPLTIKIVTEINHDLLEYFMV